MRNNFKSSVFIFIFSLCLFIPNLNATNELPFPNADIAISMDFKNASLKDLLKIFSIQSGLNFIASEAVQDRSVTLYLDKVPIKQAMDKLFKANNLSYELDNESNVIIVKDWGKPQVETVTRVFNLKYATVSSSPLKSEVANELKTTASGGKDSGITSIIRGLVSSSGQVIEDPRTNSLIVTDVPSRMANIAQTIALLDVPVAQVMLEVEMLDVQKNKVDKLGIKYPESLVQLDMSTVARTTSFPFGGSKNAFDSQGWSMSKAADTAGGWKVSPWTAAHWGPGILSVINTQLALDFLKTQTDTKVLARPKILTLDNSTAEIKITTNETMAQETITQGQGTASTTTTSPERMETGVTLRVTPQINVDTGEITMFIVPSVKDSSTTTLTGIIAKDPEERSTRSMVRIKDGETVIIGGLIRNQFSQTTTKLPILSGIPIVGALFRHKNKDKDADRELLVFITPHIIRDAGMELARVRKDTLPEREQDTESGFGRQAVISSSLNNFEKN